MERKSFLDLPAPEGYIAGSARGATGFTTTSEIGSLNRNDTHRNDSDNEELADNNENGLLGFKSKTQEDVEADKIYNDVETRLHKKRKHNVLEEAKEELKDKYAKISNEFVDLKKELSKVSENEWLNLPEAGDFTKRNKRFRERIQNEKRFYNVSDTLITDLQDKSKEERYLMDESTNFEMISSTRDKMLGAKLDQLGSKNKDIVGENDNATKEYLNHLDKLLSTESDFDVADIKKLRLIFKSLRQTNPRSSHNWISSAKLEIQAKNFDEARKILNEGCTYCSRDENIWFEYLILNENDHFKFDQIMKKSLSLNPKSEKLWLLNINFETDEFKKIKKCEKALTFINTSAKLWKLYIDLQENDEDIKRTIEIAIKLLPYDWDLYLRLLKYGSYEENKNLLNDARKKAPNSVEVWIQALRLEEDNNASEEKISKMCNKVMIKFKENDAIDWFEKCCELDKKYPKTSKGLIIGYLSKMKGDTQIFEVQDMYRKCIALKLSISITIFEYILINNPKEIPIWRDFFNYLKMRDNDRNYDELFKWYDYCIKVNDGVAEFYLRYSKDLWKLNNDIPLAKKILYIGLKQIPENLSLILGIIKLEITFDNFSKALEILQKYRLTNPTSYDILLELIQLCRQLYHLSKKKKLEDGNPVTLISLEKIEKYIDEGIKQFPAHLEQLLLIKAEHFEIDWLDIKKSKEFYGSGSEMYKHNIEFWIRYINLLIKHDRNIIKARSVLDKALSVNGTNEDLWIYKIKFEKRYSGNENGKSSSGELISKVFQINNKSSKFWDLKLRYEINSKKTEFKKLILHSMRQTNSSHLIMLRIAITFFLVFENFSKAEIWFRNSIKKNLKNIDIYCWLFIFYKKTEPKKAEEIINEIENIDNKQGRFWSVVSNDVRNFKLKTLDLVELVAEKLIEDNDI